MKSHILYLVDNVIQFYSYKKNKLIIYEIPKNILINGKVSDVKLFKKYFAKFIKEKKIKTSIFLDNLEVIVEDNFNKIDKIIMNEILTKFNFKNIKYTKSKTLLNIKSKIIYIIANNEYTTIIYMNKFNKEETIFLENNVYIKEMLNVIIRKINLPTVYFLGNKNIDLNINNSYIFTNKATFFIENRYNLKFFSENS